MIIGILGAMKEEVASIKEMMVINKEVIYGSRVYIVGAIGEDEIVLTFSRWGKVASSCTTTTLINKFDVDFIIFTGVAGAVDKKLNIGDIVIGNGFYQHDMDARPLFNQFQIPLTDKIIFKPDVDDLLRANLASIKFLEIIDSVIKPDLMKKYSISKPCVYNGVVASGDQVINDPTSHTALCSAFKDQPTLAVEMEGAAVAQVCDEFKIPYIIFRIISDKADHSAAVDFQLFVIDIACKYSAGIIREYFRGRMEKTKEVVVIIK